MKKQKTSLGLAICKATSVLLICLGLLMSIQIHAQDRKISVTGVVKDPLGETVIGVNVLEKGTTNGTITDIDGNFSLNVSPNGTLVISFIGYAEQEVPVNGKTVINVTLKEDSEMLDEVVVVGYGSMRKKDLTGSIIQIRPDKLADESPKTVQDILRGTPGLHVGMDGSAKGGGSMNIRGQRSVYTDGGHSDPLIVLDGMIFYGELSEINPDDIGQIDILKDASAAAVYGAKSANGVIIITTKKGQMGKPKINVSTSIGAVTMGKKREVYGPEGYMKFREDWYTADTYGMDPNTNTYGAYAIAGEMKVKGKYGYFQRPTAENLAKYGITYDQWAAYSNKMEGDDAIWATRLGVTGSQLQNFLDGNVFDWYDHSFRTGFNQDYNISISGAGERMNYYLSAGYLSSEGVAKGNEYSAFRANLKVEGKATNWLTIGANVNFQDRTDGDLAVDWGKQIQDNSPFASYKDENGNLVSQPMTPKGETNNNKGYNYDFDRQYKELEKGYTVLNTIFTAKVALPFNITYSFNIAPRYQFFYDRYFESAKHPHWNAQNIGVNREQAKRFDWSLNNTINWDYTFADKHHVNVTLVQEAEERKYWMDQIKARDIQPTDALGFHETKGGNKERSDFDTHDSQETADGMLARLFYSYDDRYMITAAVRRDGYSAFGTSNPRATFYSTAFAWTFTNENFFKWEPMSMGKLRISWGQNGNRSLANPYIALADLGQGTGKTQGYINSKGEYVQYRYMSVNRLANPNLRWEKTTAWNVGLDFGFLNNRIMGSIEYYVMPTTDMIMNQSLPDFSGFGSITTNLGEVENKGFELSLTTENIKTRDFEWSTTFSFSKQKNTIKHLYYEYVHTLDANGNIISTKEKDDVGNKWFIGKPISTIWDYKVTGIWQLNEYEEADKYGQRPGDPKVDNNPINDEYNADGTVKKYKYGNEDKQHLGQTSPPIHWSLRNNFTLFKDLTFSFNIYSYWGHKSVSGDYLNQLNGSSQISNAANVYKRKYWTLDNPTNDYARLNAIGPSGLTSPGKLYDRSFIRLENITIGYNIPSKIISKWGIEKLKVYGTVRNVAVWAKDWDFWDPENDKLVPRIYTFGLNLTF